MPIGKTQSKCDICGKTNWNSSMYICDKKQGIGANGCGTVFCSDCLTHPGGDFLKGGKCPSCGEKILYRKIG
jgi:hypothetical protein